MPFSVWLAHKEGVSKVGLGFHWINWFITQRVILVHLNEWQLYQVEVRPSRPISFHKFLSCVTACWIHYTADWARLQSYTEDFNVSGQSPEVYTPVDKSFFAQRNMQKLLKISKTDMTVGTRVQTPHLKESPTHVNGRKRQSFGVHLQNMHRCFEMKNSWTQIQKKNCMLFEAQPMQNRKPMTLELETFTPGLHFLNSKNLIEKFPEIPTSKESSTIRACEVNCGVHFPQKNVVWPKFAHITGAPHGSAKKCRKKRIFFWIWDGTSLFAANLTHFQLSPPCFVHIKKTTQVLLDSRGDCLSMLFFLRKWLWQLL